MRRRVVFWLAFAFAFFQLVVPVFVPLLDLQLRGIHVMMAISLVLIAYPLGKGTKAAAKFLILDLFFIAIVVAANLNIIYHQHDIYYQTAGPTTLDLILGGALTLIVLEASRRSTGWVMPLLVVFMFLYVLVLGPVMPGMWISPAFPMNYIMKLVYFSVWGLYGQMTGFSATFIAMFIIFGAILGATGGGRTFMELAALIAGRFRGGAAKSCVAASAMFGTISGSAIANVSVTGNYTIPLMKRLGYEANFAGGVEAMASTGGAITPPILGTVAFIMAAFLGIPYLKVVYHSIIPCLCFYTGLMAGVHFSALRLGLAAMPKEEIPSVRSVLTLPKLSIFVIPLTVLIWMLMSNYHLMVAGFYASAAALAIYLLLGARSISGLKERLVQSEKALSSGGKEAGAIAPILVSVSVLVGLLGVTGVAPKISELIVGLGRENLILVIPIAALIPLILGTALPISAAYIISAALVAPALLKLGIDIVAAHMLLIYYSVLAAVTPPTCTPCIIAANLAGGNWLKVSFVGMRLGIVAILMPFFFVVEPALLGIGTPLDIVLRTASALAGAVFLASGLFGYMRHSINYVFRALYIASGLMLLYPSNMTSLVGVLLALVTFVGESLLIRRARAVSTASAK